MKIKKVSIDGLLIIEPDVFSDSRGYFFEAYSKPRYQRAGIVDDFVQDNISYSSKGTIRGLHYQIGEYAQGKLCEVLLGKVLDVAVDIRFGSPTFGKYFAIELSNEKKNQFWIPPGFAHGFAVLSNFALFHYKCTALYSKKNERSIIYNDKNLAIDWHIKNPIVSEKDMKGEKFKNIDKDFEI